MKRLGDSVGPGHTGVGGGSPSEAETEGTEPFPSKHRGDVVTWFICGLLPGTQSRVGIPKLAPPLHHARDPRMFVSLWAALMGCAGPPWHLLVQRSSLLWKWGDEALENTLLEALVPSLPFCFKLKNFSDILSAYLCFACMLVYVSEGVGCPGMNGGASCGCWGQNSTSLNPLSSS